MQIKNENIQLVEGYTRLHLKLQQQKDDAFEILAITAGIGNGWEFSQTCLQASLPLWDGVECYVDHARAARSVRDLAGVCHSPQWDDINNGIRLLLHPGGPSADLLRQVGEEMLQEKSPLPGIGFSADVLFRPHGSVVEQILKVLSVDLVMEPARGGRFVRVIKTRQKEGAGMETETSEKGNTNEVAMEAILQQELPEQVNIQDATQTVCGVLLENTLSAARLPAVMTDRVRRQFTGRTFQPAELQLAVEDARSLISELTGKQVVQGPGNVQAMFSSEDQLQAAVDDLFGAPREAHLQQVKPARLSGIRELYLMLTGDDDLHGGYYPQRARLATTADFTGLVKNALNKVIVNHWQELGRAGYDWWERIATVEHFNTLNQITGTLVGTVGSLPVVNEGAAYTELVVGDSPETASFTKYGGYIPLTLELIDRDETQKLRAYPRELATAGLRKISSLVAAIFTASSGVGPTMADTGALFNTTAVTTAGGHANLRTNALSAAEWDAVSTAVYNQPLLIKNADIYYGTGPSMAINPRYLLVPRALQLTAMKILYPTLENAANIYSENMQRGQPGDVVTVPEWTDATNWAAACDPRVAPAIFIGERFGLLPEVFIAGGEYAPAVFTNDEHRLKVRHFLAVWVNDFRPLHKSNVAG
jgi:hypothetical protein